MNPNYSDPLEGLSADTQKIRNSLWWGRPHNKVGRQAISGISSPLRKLLESADWEARVVDKSTAGRSLEAWRGLWANFPATAPAILQALQENLGPPEGGAPDWWGSAYFRQQALRNVFLPTYPTPRADASTESCDAYTQKEAVRQELAGAIHECWPMLRDLYMAGAETEQQPYRHPLAITARLGLESEFQRLADWDGLSPLLRSRPTLPNEFPLPPLRPRFTPVELLNLGLKRRFEPLISAAQEAGASVDDPLPYFDGKCHSLLHAAIRSADEPMIDWVLANRPRLEGWDWLARTPFLVAARQADVATMQKLAALGADTNAVDRFGQSAAHLVIEGISTSTFNRQAFRYNGSREYTAKTPREVEQALTRAAQALACLTELGVSLQNEAQAAPKISKKNPSPFADLPRAARTSVSAKAGETWEQQMERRFQEDSTFGPKALAWMRAVKLDVSLAQIVPPEPEEEGVEAAVDAPMPAPRRRPRM